MRALLGVVCALFVACASSRHEAPRPRSAPTERVRQGDEIVVCGERFHTGTRVVLWTDPRGHNAYAGEAHHGERRNLPADVAARVARGGWSLEDLRRVVHQVVLHYDVAGTSAQCFKVLHDMRGLSCHFLLDLDGTVYQTLDLKERAWHAAEANDGSIGVEMANIGAYPDRAPLGRWYARDAGGARVALPPSVARGGLPADLVARPARPDPVRGTVHGTTLFQYDFTDEQYDALGRLLAALGRVLPRIEPGAPRGADGRVADTVVPDAVRYEGILGHYHVTKSKVDPGPAFQWERVLDDVRRHREGS